MLHCSKKCPKSFQTLKIGFRTMDQSHTIV